MKAGVGEVQGDGLKDLKNEAGKEWKVGCHGRQLQLPPTERIQINRERIRRQSGL